MAKKRTETTREREREREKWRHDRKIEMGRKRTTREGKGRMTTVEVREKC